jgi:predicted nucleic acid-binding Zn ribbon protein
MKKLISQSTFHLKGTGWYVTDYASKRGGSGEKKEKSDKDSTTKETKSSKETSKKETSSSGGKKAKN